MLNINFKKISLLTFFIIAFYEIFIKMRSILDPIKFIYSKLLQHCPTIWIIYIPVLTVWSFFILIIIFYIFIISFCISINELTYFSSKAIRFSGFRPPALELCLQPPVPILISSMNVYSSRNVVSVTFRSIFYKSQF